MASIEIINKTIQETANISQVPYSSKNLLTISKSKQGYTIAITSGFSSKEVFLTHEEFSLLKDGLLLL